MDNFTQIPNELIRNGDISLQAKVVFCYITSFNPSFPSYSSILKGTGIGSKSTVNKALKELVAYNILSYKQGNLKSKKANEYAINPVKNWNLPSSLGTPTVPKDKVLGTPSVLTSVHPVYSNNTNINNTNNSKIIQIKESDQELLNQALTVQPNNSFLKGKQDRLNQYGCFTESIRNVLHRICKVPEKKPVIPKGKLKELLHSYPAEQFLTELAKFNIYPTREHTPEVLCGQIKKDAPDSYTNECFELIRERLTVPA